MPVTLVNSAAPGVVGGGVTTTLAASSSIGATTMLVVTVPTGLQNGSYVGIGAPTSSCEIRRVTNVAGTTVTLNSALKVAHSAAENVWVTPGFWVPFEWWGAAAGNASIDSYRSLINALLDQSGDYGLIGRGTTPYYTSRPLFVNDYNELRNFKFQAFSTFAFDCTTGKDTLNGNIPNQYFLTLAGQVGTATFDAATDIVTFSTKPSSLQYDDVAFYPRPGSTMPGGIEEGRRYFTVTGDSVASAVTLSQGVTTPVDVTSSGGGEIVFVSSGLARLMVEKGILHGSQTKGLNGLYAQMQQPSETPSIRIEWFPVYGASLAGQQGDLPNIMIGNCGKGLEVAGCEFITFRAGSIEICDTNVDIAEPGRWISGLGNFGSVFGEGFHFESPGRGASLIQTLVSPGTLASGTFQLRFKNVLTAAINWNDTAAQIQTKLEAHAAIGSGNVTCTQLSGTNLSDGSVRCDFTVGTLNWELWSGSTNTATGGQMAIVNSTLTGGTLTVSYLNPNGRNISFKHGVGMSFVGNVIGGAETMLGFTPPYIKTEGTAVDVSQGPFQGFVVERLFSTTNTNVFVDDSLYGITLTVADTTGAGQWLDYFARPGRHGGLVGQHWWYTGDGGRRAKINAAGKALLELIAGTGQTDDLLNLYDTSGVIQFAITKDGWTKIGGGTPLKAVTMGATSVADGGTITHGLGTTPTLVKVTPTVASQMVSVTAVGATTFTLAIKTDAGTAGTTQTVYWEAVKI